ncbi:MAG: molybdenum cofactor biosynthesis protein C [Candidatus Solincola sediminis]|uniref:cyclic pyranopterin monophosphate synthase n=1 Tax=Candidatus Solincola sediminis TaxID=1797199 RepID=A0A1F2WJF0_9ACTN|nr:MAG: molybdenum cofactor biosynthesis protein C [Candidatus Solincola sediminis]OFW60363.1 MAG: molybdenum cofactor biosynthesis protein C [Candidatus Solincola sediminis]
MADISGKEVTERTATARSTITMAQSTLDLIMNAGIEKGDVLAVAQIAGIMGAKKTSDLIPMCHPISISSVTMRFEVDREASSITAIVTAKTLDRTGIEMEALTGASIAALTIYDMCKAVDRSMRINRIELMEKSGGRSGSYKIEE